MAWVRMDKICDCNSWNLWWHKKNTQVPIPFFLDENRIRLFLTFCDINNQGRMGYVDVNADNPTEILNYSREPLLDIGKQGSFDENGVVPTAILEDDNKVYVYYGGYQRSSSWPYAVFTGVALSTDNGNTFVKLSETPMLERTEDEMFLRTGAGIFKWHDKYRLVYAAGNKWKDVHGKLVPEYSLRYIDSPSPTNFKGRSYPLLGLDGNEYGMTTPQFKVDNDTVYMIYSSRFVTDGYRMGYAYSYDGINFARNDKIMDLSRPYGAWDSEMYCYGKVYEHSGRKYLFYSGNHYGMGGIGWAEWVD